MRQEEIDDIKGRTRREPMIEPKEISAAMAAYPADVSELLPPWDDIPKEFKRHAGTKWNELFSDWFYTGLPSNINFIAVEGIDAQKAFRHVRACMGSFQPSHEHKEAGCAYLMSLWFKEVRYSE